MKGFVGTRTILALSFPTGHGNGEERSPWAPSPYRTDDVSLLQEPVFGAGRKMSTSGAGDTAKGS